MTNQGTLAEQVLLHAHEGAALLAPLVTAVGFSSPEIDVFRGSGGPAAVVTWRRADGMTIEMHVRGSLGIVRYGWGEAALTHQDYLRARGRRGAYPGFSNSPREAFGHLESDLRGVAADVLTLTAQEFAAVAEEAESLPKPPLP